MIFRSAVIGTSVIVLAAPTSSRAPTAGDPLCGHCNEMTFDELVHHQFADPKVEPEETHECLTGVGGHYLHDCENGDGITWARGECDDEHDDCGSSFALRVLTGGDLTREAARGLAHELPALVSYRAGSSWLILKDCRGSVIGGKSVLPQQ